jgi:GxxExxY protein
VINGILYATHNELGQYARERQYGDVAERLFKEKVISTEREKRIGNSGNVLDFVIDGKVALEFKAKRIITKEDYYQVQRYLQETGLRLAIIVNFRDKYLRPKRIVKIDDWKK